MNVQRPALVAATLCVLGAARAQGPTDVLFIGNSYVYTNDLPALLEQLALSLGDTVNAESSAPGGYTFQLHSTYTPTLAAINQQPWDFVVLQEQSQLPSFPLAQVQTECFPYATQLIELVLANDSCTEPVFMMTWGRENGDADNCPSWPPVCTYDGMQQLLRDRYLQMAEDNSAWCAPIGVAWRTVREQHPALPLYVADGSHPGINGSYLAACTIYSTLFRKSTVGASFVATLDPDTALALQQFATATVLDSTATWNIGVNDPDAAFSFTAGIAGDVHFHGVDPDGSHQWLFGDGGSGAGTDPDHTYGVTGSFMVQHVVLDACGRADTVTVTIDVVITGLNEAAPDEAAVVQWIDGGLQIVSPSAAGRIELELMNAAGGILLKETVMRGMSVVLPASSATGLLLYRLTPEHGTPVVGKLIDPRCFR